MMGCQSPPESRPGRVSLKLAIRQGTQQHCIAGSAHRPGQRRADDTSSCIGEGPELPARLLLLCCSPTAWPSSQAPAGISWDRPLHYKSLEPGGHPSGISFPARLASVKW